LNIPRYKLSPEDYLAYNKEHCWQYDVRLKNLEEDIINSGFTKEYIDSLSVKDFEYKVVVDKSERTKLKEFIERHEFLGNLSQYTTHWFGAYHKDILAGVTLLGGNTHKIERLISRGACISWSPKNLASSFLMWVINWMVKNSDYRLFTAYADPTAKELGTIYQACNFYYLGQKSGTTTRYINPYTDKIVSDRFFRTRSAYKKYAKELGIQWEKNWNNDQKMLWENIPDEIEKQLRNYSKIKQSESTKVEMPSKHKYAYVKGATKQETKRLRTLFEQLNKTYPYPDNR
jgi:ATP-dependent Lon protease